MQKTIEFIVMVVALLRISNCTSTPAFDQLIPAVQCRQMDQKIFSAFIFAQPGYHVPLGSNIKMVQYQCCIIINILYTSNSFICFTPTDLFHWHIQQDLLARKYIERGEQLLQAVCCSVDKKCNYNSGLKKMSPLTVQVVANVTDWEG